jgi:23S rRNA A1618 N6-methylase RlmF
LHRKKLFQQANEGWRWRKYQTHDPNTKSLVDITATDNTELLLKTSQNKAARETEIQRQNFLREKKRETDRKTERFSTKLCNSPGHEITAEREAEKTRGDTREREG